MTNKIHSTALIHETAKIGENVEIGAYSVIGEDVIIEDGCKIDAIIVGENKKATLTINIEKLPNQKAWLGKKVGDVLKTTGATLSYRVERIYKE